MRDHARPDCTRRRRSSRAVFGPTLGPTIKQLLVRGGGYHIAPVTTPIKRIGHLECRRSHNEQLYNRMSDNLHFTTRTDSYVKRSGFFLEDAFACLGILNSLYY